MEQSEMLSNSTIMTAASSNSANCTVSNSAVPCWPLLEPALNQLFPLPADLATPSLLSSEDYLKLYTVVFEHCVGPVEGRKAGKGTGAGLNISGEQLYVTLDKYLHVRMSKWSSSLVDENTDVLPALLGQLDRLQAAEKPLTFIFTYLERHWIDRQINEPRVDILPMKQLIWSMWDTLVLEKVFFKSVLPVVGTLLQGVRRGQVELEALDSLARFVHYLRVISKPTQLESDFKATKRVMMAGAVINPRASHRDRFKEFVQFFCDGIERDCPKLTDDNVSEFVQVALQFWNEEEGRMAFLRFDKSSQVTVRNHLKALILIPNLEAFKAAFKDAICAWNVMDANAIYRLLTNRKSLLVHLDSESELAFIQKGQELLSTAAAPADEDIELLFINLIGQYYTKLDELIQTSFASRPEIYESRSKAFRVILNNPSVSKAKKGFVAKSLAKFADFVVRNFPEEGNEANLQVLMALFRLIDEKEEFLDSYGKFLALRLLTGSTIRPCSFESKLLAELKEVCGAYSVKSFERMFADVHESGSSSNTCVLTAGNWNVKGKLLPGHVLFNENQGGWPSPALSAEISEKTRLYHAKHPKRKLLWSPFLSTVEFVYHVAGDAKQQVLVKGSCMHLSMLQLIAKGDFEAAESLSPFGGIVLNSLLACGLVCKDSSGVLRLNTCYEGAEEIDLYSAVMTELLTSSSSGGNLPLTFNSTGTTPHHYQRGSIINSNTTSTISPIDKSILLQCSITRILKQLRLQSLPDLFNRISMLPKLLTRFSPSLKDVLDALKQLHEKEFVRMAVGDNADDLIDLGEGDKEFTDLDRINTSKLYIKYLA